MHPCPNESIKSHMYACTIPKQRRLTLFPMYYVKKLSTVVARCCSFLLGIEGLMYVNSCPSIQQAASH